MRKIFLWCTLLALSFFPVAGAFAATTTSETSSVVSEINSSPAIGTVQDALKSFKNLSRKERKERLKEAKKEIRFYKDQKAAGAAPSTNTLLLVILALLLPPLAVYLHQGEINGKFWLSLLLTLLFFIPGVIYALIVVLGEA